MSSSPNTLRAACIQLTATHDMPDNIRQAEALMLEAINLGAQFLALPENAFYMRGSDQDTPEEYTVATHPGVMLCQQLAKAHAVWILIGSIFVPAEKSQGSSAQKWYNRSVLINAEGDVTALYDKIHLFDAMVASDQQYRESDRIAYGDRLCMTATPWGQMGLTICYDMRFPQLYRDLAKAGVTLFVAPAAFTYVTGKAHWHILLRARAIETGSFIIAPGQCGIHSGGRRTYGHSLIVGPWGEILAEASEDTPQVLLADLPLQQVMQVRRDLPCLQHDRAYRSCDNV
ncbi:MAG: carbon-nitrogen hydrolase family protein [Rickettsiales bacterium]|nr:carbon-nitrogen hydrolase family protein [Rickettsiales bacterium]